MIEKPSLVSNENDLVKFAHNRVNLSASGSIKEAFSILDQSTDSTRHNWTPEDIKEVTFDHFDDGKQPKITSPDNVEGTIKKDVFKYDDGSGWGVEYDLPMNGVVSDFTLMFSLIKTENKLLVILDDCHVM